MREDMPDVDDLPAVLDHRDQPVLVAADVEHRESIHGIGMRKVGAEIGQMVPRGSFGNAVPVQQRLQRIRVRLRELVDRRLADDAHHLKVTKTVTAAQVQLPGGSDTEEVSASHGTRASPRADFQQVCLKGADLTGTNLEGINLSGAILSGQNLSKLTNSTPAEPTCAEPISAESTSADRTSAD